jgi:hypothetical protein
MAVGNADKFVSDYVIRHSSASSAGVEKRWVFEPTLESAALRNREIQPEPRVSRSEAASSKRLVRVVPSSARNWLAINAVQQFSLNKKMKTKNTKE